MNRFARTRKLIGDESLLKLKNARVAVCGLGAVGSYAVEGLARAGVGYLRIIDFDYVDESNINRQLFALSSTLGNLKTETAVQRIKDINPECEVDIRDVFIDAETAPSILEKPIDAVIDAIDGLSSKVSLIAEAVRSDIFIVSSMGAALRLDPSGVKYGDLFSTSGCPLARLVRRRLRKIGISSGVQCVYSSEAVAMPEEDREFQSETLRGRPRLTLGSISYMTGIFGLTAAGEIIRHIISKNDQAALVHLNGIN